MQRITLHLAIMVLTFLIGVTVTSSWVSYQSNLGSKKEVLELTGKLHEALVNNDVETLDRMTPDDFTWIMVDDIHVDKSKWVRMIDGEGFRFKAIDIDHIKTSIDGSKAVLKGRIITPTTFNTEHYRSVHTFIYSFIVPAR